MKKLILAALLAASTSANADCFLTTAAADVVSTDIAVNNGAVEANPLGVGGVIVAKAGIYLIKKYAGGEVEKAIDLVACPVMAGASANNFALATGLASNVTLPIGAFVAYLYYKGAKFGPVTVTYANPN